MSKFLYSVCWTDNGVLYERIGNPYKTYEAAVQALDILLGAMRRKRLTEAAGWFFIKGPSTVTDPVGMGGKRTRDFPLETLMRRVR